MNCVLEVILTQRISQRVDIFILGNGVQTFKSAQWLQLWCFYARYDLIMLRGTFCLIAETTLFDIFCWIMWLFGLLSEQQQQHEVLIPFLCCHWFSYAQHVDFYWSACEICSFRAIQMEENLNYSCW